MSKPLEGVRILEVSGYLFVPAACAAMSDLGATVIKVEPPTGDPARGLMNALTRTMNREETDTPSLFIEFGNRGKRSVTLDLESTGGKRALSDLIQWADVFVTSYLPAVRERLGVDVDAVREINPKIIYTRGSGWGPSGPERNRPGFDLAAGWASGGAGHRLSDSDGEPMPMPPAFFDLQGAQALVGGVSAALFKREKTGEPSVVDVSLLNVGWWTMQPDIVYAPWAKDFGRMTREAPGNPLVNWYKTSDGRWLYLVCMQADRFWVELCQKLGQQSLTSDPRFIDAEARYQNNVACVSELDAIFGCLTLQECRERLADFTGVWAPVLSPQEIHEHPQGMVNGYLTPHKTMSGFDVKLVAPPMQFDEEHNSTQCPAPELGQHTEEVMLELGMDWETIAELRESGAFG